MTKISVIIPIYNMGKYIGECLDSILNQTLKEIEIICIDDGSTDDSLNIVKKYCKEYKNIILICQENQGAGSAKNRGIMSANGKYIAFMDPDDYYACNETLEKLYHYAEKNNVLACGGNLLPFDENGAIGKRTDWFDENGKVLFQDYGCFCNYTCYLFNLEMIRENHILFPSYRRYEDPPFLLKVMAHIKEFYAINETVYMYRVGHKELIYTSEIARDILQGIRDCFRIAYKMDVVKVYKEHLKNTLINFLPYFYPNLVQNNEKLWNLIKEINQISQEWMGEYNEIFSDKEHMNAYINKIKEEFNDMLSKCRKENETVIYGAGKIGKLFLEKYGRECRHIAGFAVTRQDESNRLIENYAVKDIRSYSREAFVVVAVGKKYAKEILENIKLLQFQNVCYIPYSDIMLLEKISNKGTL